MPMIKMDLTIQIPFTSKFRYLKKYPNYKMKNTECQITTMRVQEV